MFYEFGHFSFEPTLAGIVEHVLIPLSCKPLSVVHMILLVVGNGLYYWTSTCLRFWYMFILINYTSWHNKLLNTIFEIYFLSSNMHTTLGKNTLYMQMYVDTPFKWVDLSISATPVADRRIKSSTHHHAISIDKHSV